MPPRRRSRRRSASSPSRAQPRQWGGDVEVVKTSATAGTGIKELLETLDLQSQVLELKADFGGPARGTVIEARTEEGRGAVANILVQQGKLKVGDFIVLGRGFGRVRDITDDRGNQASRRPPAHARADLRLDEVPDAGDKFYVVDTLKKAAGSRRAAPPSRASGPARQPKVTLDNLFNQMADKDVKEILVVLKAAEQGTVDVLKAEIEKVKGDEVKRPRSARRDRRHHRERRRPRRRLQARSSSASTSSPSGKARTAAEQKGVEIRTYEVIYDIVDDLKKAAEGCSRPNSPGGPGPRRGPQGLQGHEGRQHRRLLHHRRHRPARRAHPRHPQRRRHRERPQTRAAQARQGRCEGGPHAGMECGMKIDGYDDIKEGDILECYKQVEVKRTL
jgi:translation initiation factor IF-2